MNYPDLRISPIFLFLSCFLCGCAADTSPENHSEHIIKEISKQVIEQEDTMEQQQSIDTSLFKEKVYVMVDQLKLRARPDLNSPVLAKIDLGKTLLTNGKTAGEELEITMRSSKRKGNFLQVYLPWEQQLIGWIYAGALAKKEEIFTITPTTEKSKIELLADIKSGWRLLLFEEGYYKYENELALTTDYGTESNLIVKGQGDVKIVCTDPDANVIWMGGDCLACINLHCYHDPPNESAEEVYCSGNVITIDIAKEVHIAHCNLNGSGRVGIYFNLGLSEAFIRNNEIHNNSCCPVAYYDNGKNERITLFDETTEVPELHFINNNIYNNGEDRNPE